MPVKFVSAGHFISTGKWTHPVRTIDTAVLILGEQGVASIYEGDEQYRVGPGDTLLLTPHVEHGGFEVSENVSYYWLHFYNNTLQNGINAFQNLVYPVLGNTGDEKNSKLFLPAFFSMLQPDKLSILTHQLLHVFESQYHNSKAADYLMTSVLIELAEQYGQHISMSIIKDLRSFYSICEWIRINCHTKLSLNDVAERFSYNKNYLCRMFKQNAGITVNEYINRIKITKVKQYLYSGGKSVQEIAYLVGFNDEKYMMRLFKSMEGITPTQFRNAYNRTHINSR